MRTVLLLAAAALVAIPGGAHAQVVQLRFGYGLSTLSTPDWTPLYGPSAGLELNAGGRWHVGAAFRAARRDLGRVPAFCPETAQLCVEGPFELVGWLRSYGIDVGRRLLQAEPLMVRSTLRLRIYEQWRDSIRSGTGEQRERDFFRDPGMGLSLEAVSTVGRWGFSPRAWLAYDRILETSFASHGPRYGARNHVELGVGLAYGR